MRLKDLRWHILFSVILIISYAAIAFCYYLSISSGKVESSMKELGLEKSTASIDILNETLKSYYELYINDNTNQNIGSDDIYLFHPCNIQTGLKSKFDSLNSDIKVIISSAGSMEGERINSYDYNKTLYAYFYKDTTSSSLVSRIELNSILNSLYTNENWFTFYFEERINTNHVVSKNGNVNITNTIFTALQDSASINGYFNESITLEGEKGIISGNKILNTDIYMAFFITTADAFLGISWVLTQAIIFYSAGVVVCILMLLIIIHGAKKASQLLRVDRHVTEKTKAIVIRVDKAGNVIFTNKTFKQMYGATKLTSVDQVIDVSTGEPIKKTIVKNQPFECSIITDDGKTHYLQLSPLYILKTYYLTGSEITIEYERRLHLEEMSGKNEVTHCDNDFTLTNQYRSIVAANDTTDLAFIQYKIVKHEDVIKVFGRKNYNKVQIEFLNKLRELFIGLSIFQLEDDEFWVISPNLDINEVVNTVSKSLTEFARPFKIEKNNIALNVKSVIYNLKRNDYGDVTLEQIKEKLELALKSIIDFNGKDLIVYDPMMDGIILAKDEMEKDLEQGLINNEFKMFLQPQFDIVSNKIDGFEALIRWMNPKYSRQSPQAFIELAEERGYMLDIGRFVISESFKLAKKLEPYHIHVSVNVSPIQLLQAGFVQSIIDEYKSLNLKQGSIAIEITETFLMDNFHLMNEKLHVLRDLGFHIHLDDFCTGYSSMLYLKDLPVDTIKIDKEFTKNIITSKTSETIVKTICSLANSLDLDIVCEGVETEEQSNMVKKFGCRIIQGYLIGKAMPYEEALVLLEKYNGK